MFYVHDMLVVWFLCQGHDEEINDDCGRVFLASWTVSFGWEIMGECLFGTS